ncbi:MAG: Ca-activated chloride channel family protein, partial [Pirellulaceae bacterium]
QGRVSVAGRLLASKADIKLHFAYGPATMVVSYTLRQDENEFNRLVPRIWAQKKVDGLLAFPEEHRDELISLGREFGFVTPGTSLLVLETLEQYLEYGVEPPQSREIMHANWLKQVEQRRVAKEKSRDEKIKEVVAQWTEQVKWWEKEYKYPKNFKYREQTPKKNADEPGRVEATPNDAAAPLAPAAPREGAPSGGRAAARGEAAEEEAADKDNGGDFAGATTPKSSIALKPWDPQTPYLKAMTAAGPAKAYEVYLGQREQFADSPAFYLDCATYFFREASAADGVRVLTNVVELELEDPRLTRIVAHKLQQEGNLNLAVTLFEKVLKLRPEEPQSYRDLALALSDRGQTTESSDKGARAFSDYQRAVSLLNEVIVGTWDDRFPGIETIALMELNQLIARAGRLDFADGKGLQANVDPRLLKLLDVDIRILISWDTDLTDIDAWIIEPSGEKCFYSHNRTTIGGMMTQDFTQGYGPEVYNLRKAMPGKYQIKAHFYGSSQQTLTGGTTIAATVITNYGRPNESRKSITVRLSSQDEEVDIGSIVFGKQ